MFYSYRQNNSGGSFHYDEEAGISCMVVVEAKDAREANYLAERIGLYFDGSGDCSCCGDRWYEMSEYYGEGELEPMHYGERIADVKFGSYPLAHKWMKGFEFFVHYADGRIVGFGQ